MKGKFIRAVASCAMAFAWVVPVSARPSPGPGKHLFYLHAMHIEDQGIRRPESEGFGFYEFVKILEAFRERGYTVHSEMRPANTDARACAEKVAGEARKLLLSGVSPDRVTVIGASKGGIMAMLASALLQNRDVNFVFLSCCYDGATQLLQDSGMQVAGNMLSIYDDANDTGCGSCRRLFARSQGKNLGCTREIVLTSGLGHGILYRPLPEWLEPAAAWAGGN